MVPQADLMVEGARRDAPTGPGDVCRVCYASACDECDFVFDDVADASPQRAPNLRLLCHGCAPAPP